MLNKKTLSKLHRMDNAVLWISIEAVRKHPFITTVFFIVILTVISMVG